MTNLGDRYLLLTTECWPFYFCFFLGIELEEFMPSLESLFEAEELKNAGLSENPQFRFLLKSGYEQIERASAVSS